MKRHKSVFIVMMEIEWENMRYHVESIRRGDHNAVGILVNVGTIRVNPRLDFAMNRGFTNERWEILLQPLRDIILINPEFNPEGDTTKFLYDMVKPVMIDAIKHYYKHGQYPFDGIVEYQTWRNKVQFADWFYYTF